MSGLVFLLAPVGYSQRTSATPKTPTDTLRHYINLRLQWADWSEYSRFITWPDEPGWDCWWVARGYSVNRAVGSRDRVVIPVSYSRLGLFCVNFDFESNPKAETVRYELVRRGGVWKINGPVPDYPYLQWQVLRDWSAKQITDEQQLPERKKDAQNALDALAAAAARANVPR